MVFFSVYLKKKTRHFQKGFSLNPLALSPLLWSQLTAVPKPAPPPAPFSSSEARLQATWHCPRSIREQMSHRSEAFSGSSHLKPDHTAPSLVLPPNVPTKPVPLLPPLGHVVGLGVPGLCTPQSCLFLCPRSLDWARPSRAAVGPWPLRTG